MHRYELIIRMPEPLAVAKVVEAVGEALSFPVSDVHAGIDSHDFYVMTPKPPFFSDISVYMEKHTVDVAVWRDAPPKPSDIDAVRRIADALRDRFGASIEEPQAAKGA